MSQIKLYTSKLSKNDKNKSFKYVLIALAVILVAAIIIVFVSVRIKKSANSNVKRVANTEAIKEQLNIDIKEPDDASDVTYDIENNTIARVTYQKVVSEGKTMNFIMRSSYSLEEDLTDLGYEVTYSNQPIHMTSICDDGSEIDVESYVALGEENEMKYMRAVWFDNDKYYSMVTDNLVTREDFLQEVNRVIIANHIPF